MKTNSPSSLRVASGLKQHEFIARGLASRDEARRTCEYYTTEEVLQELDDMLTLTKKKMQK